MKSRAPPVLWLVFLVGIFAAPTLRVLRLSGMTSCVCADPNSRSSLHLQVPGHRNMFGMGKHEHVVRAAISREKNC